MKDKKKLIQTNSNKDKNKGLEPNIIAIWKNSIHQQATHTKNTFCFVDACINDLKNKSFF